ncbi:MAG: SAM-dependent methyltransferase [Erysipelotrichaceae bacterium]|nr:SAM-dependent methyltransferase [Erysipelotrichaceae bacterium]
MNQIADAWQDYECLDIGNKEKLERWGNIVLRRPEPQAIWPIQGEDPLWRHPHAHYHRAKSGGGAWEYHKQFPKSWTIRYKDLCFKVSPTGFKHTGLFPEQAANWDFLREQISQCDEKVRILNLFAYTGGATMACAKAGADEVVHVDASKGMVQWAKENMALSNLSDHKIRFIVDDVFKFVAREKRRGRTYHGIIMDPPSYGRGPNKEVWKIEEQLYDFILACLDILDEHPLFFLVNSYSTGFSPTLLKQLLQLSIGKKYPQGVMEAGENSLPITRSESLLPCGIYGRWVRK